MLGKLGVGYMENSLWYHYISVNLKFTVIRPKKFKVYFEIFPLATSFLSPDLVSPNILVCTLWSGHARNCSGINMQPGLLSDLSKLNMAALAC